MTCKFSFHWRLGIIFDVEAVLCQRLPRGVRFWTLEPLIHRLLMLWPLRQGNLFLLKIKCSCKPDSTRKFWKFNLYHQKKLFSWICLRNYFCSESISLTNSQSKCDCSSNKTIFWAEIGNITQKFNYQEI